ncbi:NAD(P)H-dependent oxidoreductase [Campylobacter hyointestinalis]|uniref:NAD(P)H-dependent oxidoreductase n=1 Tax=Campylobacter hyointestinalis TaxID=198 RepID=UPI001C6754F7|nr:NAD(P)H-dependent oxidoreductase [Campylobacter hyointestinalis]
MKKLLLGLMLIFGAAFGEDAPVKTLIIASHPYKETSTFFKGLKEAAQTVGNVTIHDLEEIYGYDTRSIDGEKERQITREHERIVFLFPTHWFNITPMMKAYLNETWGSIGPWLWQGKEMLVVSTAAGGASTYGKNGRIYTYESKRTTLWYDVSTTACISRSEPLATTKISRSIYRKAE